MKFFAGFLLSIAASNVCLVQATPAHAEVTPRVISVLQRIGIDLNINSKSCGPSRSGSGGLYGYYEPGPNRMCIVDHSIIGASAWYRTLMHESWHVVQDDRFRENENE